MDSAQTRLAQRRNQISHASCRLQKCSAVWHCHRHKTVSRQSSFRKHNPIVFGPKHASGKIGQQLDHATSMLWSRRRIAFTWLNENRSVIDVGLHTAFWKAFELLEVLKSLGSLTDWSTCGLNQSAVPNGAPAHLFQSIIYHVHMKSILLTWHPFKRLEKAHCDQWSSWLLYQARCFFRSLALGLCRTIQLQTICWRPEELVNIFPKLHSMQNLLKIQRCSAHLRSPASRLTFSLVVAPDAKIASLQQQVLDFNRLISFFPGFVMFQMQLDG